MTMLSSLFARCARQKAASRTLVSPISRRCFSNSLLLRQSLDQKYLEKLRKRAEEKGLSLKQLVEDIKSKTSPQKLPEAEQFLKKVEEKGVKDAKEGWSSSRKDNSPVKPLSDFMNVPKILENKHTPEQISALWTGYHSSLSKGTGRGYISAVIPIDTYNSLTKRARSYPSFLLPLRRSVNSKQVENASENDEAFEFYFMQWAFHPSAPVPSSDLFTPPTKSTNPDISTILFTPLQEYKLRQTFATPHLILTNYTDFVSSHGVVLMRGELTPSSQRAGEYLLSQQDAQLLAFGLQRFYLPGGDAKVSEGTFKLLESFHETPAEFEWEKLLQYADPTRS